MRIAAIIILPCLLLAGCKGAKKHRLQSEKGLKVRFEIENFQEKMGDCSKQDGACAQIDMVYPFVAEGVPAIQQSINDSIFGFLIQNLVFEEFPGEHNEANLTKAAKSFLQEWQAASKEDPDDESNANWEVSVTGEVGLHTPKVASITLGSYAYAGGAHPNSYVAILNFDLKTGKSLIWQDFITDVGAMKKLAEKEFKKARELSADADLEEEGFFWGEPFALPKNFELQRDGIYFWYNPFEVAAYAQGPTDFLITYDDLGKLFRKDAVF